MKDMWKEFKEFIGTGNLVAIAIGLLMGVEIGKVVSSFVNNIFTPIFAMIGGKPDLDEILVITINHAQFKLGAFMGSLINFVIVAFVAFIIVKAATKLFPPTPKDESPSEVELLTEIRDSLKSK